MTLKSATVAGLVLLAASVVSRGAASASVNGVYTLNTTDFNSVATNVLTNNNVTGVALRFTWATLEPTEGNYNWALVDSLIAFATQFGKPISISIQAGYVTPQWVYTDGAKAFNFLWDQPIGPAYCTQEKIPPPYDAVFLSKWETFITAFGARYAGNPAITSIKLTGVNSETQETFVPTTVDESINNGQCIGYNSTSEWQKLGYTRTLVENAWESIAQTFAAAFPNTPLEAAVIPGGFPPLDQNGNIISGQTVDYQVTTDILAYGATNFTTNFAPQNDALSSTFLWSGITQYAGTIPIGFQTVSAMGSGLSQATTPAVNAGADFLELYASDVTDPALQSYIQSLNASLLAN